MYSPMEQTSLPVTWTNELVPRSNITHAVPFFPRFVRVSDSFERDEPGRRSMLGGAVNGRPFSSSGSGQLGQPARLLLALFTRECMKSAAPPGASVCRSHQMGLRTGVRHCCSLRSSLPMSVSLPRQ